MLLAVFWLWLLAFAQTATSPALELAGEIALPGVTGRLDHFAADVHHGRLFLAAPDHNSVEVIDVRANKHIASITGLSQPHDIAYLFPANRLFVTNGGDGTVRIFDAATFKPLQTVRVGPDADSIRLDAARGRMFAGYGEGMLAMFDLNGKKLAEAALKSHPESFQLSANRIFVNVPAAHAIAVFDLQRFRAQPEWPLTAKDALENFPMALDEANRRLFVVCRRPARLLVLDMDSGLVLAHLPASGDAGDLSFDPIHARIYVSCGEGRLALYSQISPDRYTPLGFVSTQPGARTSLFVAEWNLFFVAFRDSVKHGASIRMYRPR